MRHAWIFALIPALSLITSCIGPRSVIRGADVYGNVTVVWKLKYYAVGKETLLSNVDTNMIGKVSGFVMEVVEPPEYAGQILTAHFDGAWFYNAFEFYRLGTQYREEVPKYLIGDTNFRLCR